MMIARLTIYGDARPLGPCDDDTARHVLATVDIGETGLLQIAGDVQAVRETLTALRQDPFQ